MSESVGTATRGAGGLGASSPSDLTRSPLTWIVLGLLAVLRRALWMMRAAMVRQRPHCRFHPTCSEYAVQAVRTHGAIRGSLHALRRLTRCHPWNPGGVDPVPTRE